jgi:hypothetical protein
MLDDRTRQLLEAPFAAGQMNDDLRHAIWLYLWLLTAANSQGYVCRTVDRLATDLGVAVPEVQAWLDRLAEAQLVRITTPPPYLVLKLAFWSGNGAQASIAKPEFTSESMNSHREVPVSSKQAASILEDEGLGEGEPLVREILRVLGGGSGHEIRELVGQFPKLVVLKALLRVKTTPPHTIRKSKLALFRYLLVAFAADHHDHHRSHHP